MVTLNPAEAIGGEKNASCGLDILCLPFAKIESCEKTDNTVCHIDVLQRSAEKFKVQVMVQVSVRNGSSISTESQKSDRSRELCTRTWEIIKPPCRIKMERKS